jgi:hypothetical protein
MNAKGLWFVRRIDRKLWQPTGGSGFDDLSTRADYEDYIRKYKLGSAK